MKLDPLFQQAVNYFNSCYNRRRLLRFNPPLMFCAKEVTEDLDPSLKPILLQNTYVKGGHTLIKIGDTEIEYNSNFRFVKKKSSHFLQVQ